MSYVSAFVSRRDALVDLIKKRIREIGSIEDAFRHLQELFDEHYAYGLKLKEAQEESGSQRVEELSPSRLSKLVPELGLFFTPLNLVQALHEYDQKYFVTARKYIPPSFREIRHILNTAQIHSIANSVKLVTFDADGTIYEDGGYIGPNSPLKDLIISLLRLDGDHKLNVAIVTAAGYPHAPARYEERFEFLIRDLKNESEDVRSRFWVVGGECNYCFKCSAEGKLVELEDDQWKSPTMKQWRQEDIQELLERAKEVVERTARSMNVWHKFNLIVKERAIGLVPVSPQLQTRNEAVDEIAMAVQHELGRNSKIPFCSFASYHQVWVDIGNKSLGVEALQLQLGIDPNHTLHIGDQWNKVGNDIAARQRSACLWVTMPKETKFFIELLLADMQRLQQQQQQANN